MITSINYYFFIFRIEKFIKLLYVKKHKNFLKKEKALCPKGFF